MRGKPVTLCGVVGNTGDPDGDGIRWTFDLVSGWDSPEQDVQLGAATGRAGATLLSDEVGARRPAIDGMARADSPAGGRVAYRTAKAQLPPIGAAGFLDADLDGVLLRAVVRRAIRPRVDFLSPTVVSFHLELAALNPWLLTLTPETVTIPAGGQATITNDGTAPTWLAVTANAAGTVNVLQTTSGQRLKSKPGAAPSGAVFDSTDRRVTSAAGAVLLGVVDNPSEWLSVAAESAAIVKNEGTVSVDVTHHHAYV